jgi:hypothetical protein
MRCLSGSDCEVFGFVEKTLMSSILTFVMAMLTIGDMFGRGTFAKVLLI